jgi:hypothetical protein
MLVQPNDFLSRLALPAVEVCDATDRPSGVGGHSSTVAGKIKQFGYCLLCPLKLLTINPLPPHHFLFKNLSPIYRFGLKMVYYNYYYHIK